MSILATHADDNAPSLYAGDGPTRMAPNIQLDIVSDWNQTRNIITEWDELVERTNAEISSCPTYARIWWDHYGRGSLAIIVCREQTVAASASDRGRLVGILPMFIESLAHWPIGGKIARFIGCDSTIAVMSPPIEPDWADEVMKITVSKLLNDHKCDIVHFGQMQGNTLEAGAVRGVGSIGTNQMCPNFKVRERVCGTFTRWDLPGGFEDYLASLEKSDRNNLRRNLNKINKAVGSRVRSVTEPSEVACAFDRFVPLHTEQWRAERKPGHFGDWAGSEAFARELTNELSKAGRVSFVEQEIDGDCVSLYWSYRLRERAYWRLPARAVGEKWEPYSLGRVGLATMLKELMASGVRYVDGGPGHYDYKLRLGATEHPLVSFLVVRSGFVSHLRTLLFTMYADCIHMIYYRLWRLKIAPKYGWKCGPLNKQWVRTRV